MARAGDATAALSVAVAVSETGSGDFVTTSDEGSRTVTFAAGKSTARVYAVTADAVDDGGHNQVKVAVSSGTGYAVAAAPGDAATIKVRDDDGDLVSVSVDPSALSVREGTPARVDALATAVDDGTFDDAADIGRLLSGTGFSLTVSTADGTATAPDDYAALSGGTATIAYSDFSAAGDGALAARAALPEVATVREDPALDDGGQTFTVSIAKASGTDARVVLGTSSATVTLVEGPADGKLRLCGPTGRCVHEDGRVDLCDAAGACVDQGRTVAVPSEGRLEVAVGGEWGTVCDDNWALVDVHVACRQLGHAAAQRVYSRSHFGGAARGVPIWYDDVGCTGDETVLADCPKSTQHNCSTRHTEDAGVGCLAETTATPAVGVDPVALTVPAGGAGNYWLWLTKQPDFEDFRVDANAPAGGEVTVAPESLVITRHRGWSHARSLEVSVSEDAAAGESHIITHEAGAGAYLDGSVPAVPDVTVTVGAAAGSGAWPLGAAMEAGALAVRFDAPLDSVFAPAPADFVVTAGREELGIAAAWVRGAELVLEPTGELPAGVPVRVAYTAAPSSALTDRSGRPVAPFELAVPPGRAVGATLAGGVGSAKLEGTAGLAAAVAEALRDAPGPEAAALWAPRRGVTDLSAVAELHGLRRLNLSANAVERLEPLAALRGLRRLDLSDNAVADVWPLAGLVELEVLDLSGNRIVDVSALGGLPRLKALELADNRGRRRLAAAAPCAAALPGAPPQRGGGRRASRPSRRPRAARPRRKPGGRCGSARQPIGTRLAPAPREPAGGHRRSRAAHGLALAVGGGQPACGAGRDGRTGVRSPGGHLPGGERSGPRTLMSCRSSKRLRVLGGTGRDCRSTVPRPAQDRSVNKRGNTMSDETGKALEEATDEANGLPGRRSEEGGAGAPERELERLARTVVAGFRVRGGPGSVRSLEGRVSRRGRTCGCAGVPSIAPLARAVGGEDRRRGAWRPGGGPWRSGRGTPLARAGRNGPPARPGGSRSCSRFSSRRPSARTPWRMPGFRS